jgi:tetratricopeptide (TPR) repeat protein
MLSRQAKGLVLAQRGQAVEAERLLREAIALAASTHSPELLGDAYYDLGTSMTMLGEREKAVAAFKEAIALYEPKENLVMAERARRKLAELDAQA